MPCRPTCIQPSPSNAHCSACHVTFGGITGFDRHRRGGQCINPRELAMHCDRNGVWRMAPPDPTVRTVWPKPAQADGNDWNWQSDGKGGWYSGPGTPDAPEVWSSACAPGGYVCGANMPDHPDGICGMPVEDEPCSIHAPAGTTA